MKIDKIAFWKALRKETGNTVHRLHILSIITILIDEIKKDFLNGKDVKITNFGTFRLKKTNEREFVNVNTKTIDRSRSQNKLELKLVPKLSKLISEKIDEEIKNE